MLNTAGGETNGNTKGLYNKPLGLLLLLLLLQQASCHDKHKPQQKYISLKSFMSDVFEIAFFFFNQVKNLVLIINVVLFIVSFILTITEFVAT